MNPPADPLLDWLAREAWLLPGVPEALAGLADRLVAEGIPVGRAWYGSLLRHPLLRARSWTWRRGDPIVQVGVLAHTASDSAMAASPISLLAADNAWLRFRLDTPQTWPQLEGLRSAGATDYVALGLGRGTGLEGAFSFTSDHPDGFSAAHLERLAVLQPYLGLVFRTWLNDDFAATLLRTYLGRDAGERVRSGQIRRGDGETLRAAVWFADLRGFTAATERLPQEELLALLNDWFGATVAAVEGQGGNVLKFIGDGLLAVFRDEDPGLACRAALAAAIETGARIGDRHRYGIALHFGDLIYGNIGAPERLDFTVIGAAVNRAARMESVAASLGRPLVVSSTFAALCDVPMRSLGMHVLKGVSEPEEILEPVEQP